MKHLPNVTHPMKLQGGRYVLGIWRPLNAKNFVVMTSIRSVQNEGGELADEMIWRFPDLDMRVVGNRYVPNPPHLVQFVERGGHSANHTHFPSGENLMSLTGLWKLKWWRTTPLRKLTRRARPSTNGRI